MTHITKQVLEELREQYDQYASDLSKVSTKLSPEDFHIETFLAWLESNLQPELPNVHNPLHKVKLEKLANSIHDEHHETAEIECKHGYNIDLNLCAECIKESGVTLGASGQPPTREPIKQLDNPPPFTGDIYEFAEYLQPLLESFGIKINSLIERVNQLTGNTR